MWRQAQTGAAAVNVEEETIAATDVGEALAIVAAATNVEAEAIGFQLML